LPRAGESLQDLCRACKSVRTHTVIVADPQGNALRVICDHCGSQHNYRGGERPDTPRPDTPRADAPRVSAAAGRSGRDLRPLVSERERRFPPMKIESADGNVVDLEMMLRQILREEAGLTALPPAEKWRDGLLVLRPGRADLQEKSWPIETFFHKVVMLRNRLRVLEQQINGADIPEELKLRLQGYITGCYGTLTSFNVLFSEEEDRFRGSGEKE